MEEEEEEEKGGRTIRRRRALIRHSRGREDVALTNGQLTEDVLNYILTTRCLTNQAQANTKCVC